MAVSGVRGAFSLAGLLTFPLTLSDATVFRARDLAVFLAAGVIIGSILIASVLLPWLLKSLELPVEPTNQVETNQIRIIASQAAIAAIERRGHAMATGRGNPDLFARAADRVMEVCRERIDDQTAVSRCLSPEIGCELRLAGLVAVRCEVHRALREGRLNSEAARWIACELDLLEIRVTALT